VDHTVALEAVHRMPQLVGQRTIVGGGDVEPLGDGVDARVGGWRLQRTDLE
jgi:hypothetical protein